MADADEKQIQLKKRTLTHHPDSDQLHQNPYLIPPPPPSRSAFTWKISDPNLLSKLKESKPLESIKSPFKAFGLTFYFELYPNGSTQSDIGQIEIFISLASIPTNISTIILNTKLSLLELNQTISNKLIITKSQQTNSFYGPKLNEILNLNQLTFTFESELLNITLNNNTDVTKQWLQSPINVMNSNTNKPNENIIRPIPKKSKISIRKKKKKKKKKTQQPTKYSLCFEKYRQLLIFGYIRLNTHNFIPTDIMIYIFECYDAPIALIAVISERLDCLLNNSGQIIKYQIVGHVYFKHNQMLKDVKKTFYARILNTDQTKTKIFNPSTTESLDKNGKICVKLNTKNNQEIGVMKYVWKMDGQNIQKHLPFCLEIITEQNEDLYTVCCMFGLNNSNIKELSIHGLLRYDVLKCIEFTKMKDVEFVWSKDESRKFNWNIKTANINQQYALISKFKLSTEENQVRLKMEFVIEDFGISSVGIEFDPYNESNDGYIIETKRQMRSGEIVVR